MQITRKITWQLMRAPLAIACAVAATLLLYGSSTAQSPPAEQSQIALLSEINGYLAWESELQLYPLNDVEAFIKGVRARAANKNPPQNMTNEELYRLTQEVEFEAHKKKIDENLENAEAFLAEVAKKPGVICAVENLLYYKVAEQGSGPALVNDLGSYYFDYSVGLADGTVLFDTKGGGQQKVSLDAVIPGFTKGVAGMKAGERRILYIHPNLGFRTMHWTVPPNVVLVMDVCLR